MVSKKRNRLKVSNKPHGPAPGHSQNSDRLEPNRLSLVGAKSGERKEEGKAMSPLSLVKVNFRPSKVFFPVKICQLPSVTEFSLASKFGRKRKEKTFPLPRPRKRKGKRNQGFFLFLSPTLLSSSLPPLRSPSAASRVIPHTLIHRGRDTSSIPSAFGLYFLFPPNSTLLFYFFLIVSFSFYFVFFFLIENPMFSSSFFFGGRF